MFVITSLVDLHTHSNCSDGSMSPSELVLHAAEKGLAAIALTDHDTVDGIKEAVAKGKENGIEVMFDDSQRNCHLLTEGGVNCFLMGTKYNRHDREGLRVVNDWSELYDVVCRLSEEKGR